MPVIPEWVLGWGWKLLVPAGLVLLLISCVIGVRDGSASGWTLALAMAAVAAVLGGWDYLRRLREYRALLEQALYERSEFPKIDKMEWKEFEYYCADLLGALGYTDVEVIGSRPEEGGLDILATAPDRALVGVQVKHRKPNAESGRMPPIEPDRVRGLHGAVMGRQYAGRRGILMTNTYVQPGGREFARQNGLIILDRREGLGDWMGQARKNSGLPVPPAGASSVSALGRLRPETQVTLGVICCAAIAVLVVAIHAMVSGPRRVPAAAPPAARAAAMAERSAASAVPASQPARPPDPVQVVGQFYAAISSHDWPQVWRLGGRNLGQGPYATYSGMISGYHGTIRDVLTEAHATGNTVTGRFVAYQAGGVTRLYRFTYVVRGGVIISGHQL